MARRLFDFKCDSGHVTERFVDVDTRSIHCVDCDCIAFRQIRAPLIPVGVLGAYWASDRAKKQAKENS